MQQRNQFRYLTSDVAKIGLLWLCTFFWLSCSRELQQPPASPVRNSASPYQGQLEADDGQWIRPAKDYASTRYSSLREINTENVKQLQVAWTFSTGTTRGLEAAPLVVNNTLYLVTPWPNILYALDLTQPGAPMKWAYDPKPVASAKGVACCDWVNRGAVYGFGKIFYNTLDNYTVAVDATTGKEVWKTKLGDINKGESMTMAPLLVKDKIIVGNSGGEFGARGWVTALDAQKGSVVWRAYSTGPDSDVLIGPNFKPFYPQDRGKDLGVTSWPPEAWKIGGRRNVGMDFLRSIAESHLPRHCQSRPMGRGRKAWR